MNDAVYKFRRYEDASLTYTGIDKHKGEHAGLFDTSLSELDYLEAAQQDSLILPNGLDKRQKETLGKRDSTDKLEPLETEGESALNGAGETDKVSIGIEGNEWVVSAIETAGLQYVDKRDTGGNLWVLGGREIVIKISELHKQGANF